MKRGWILMASAWVVLGGIGLVGFGALFGLFEPAKPPVSASALDFRLDPVGLAGSPQIKMELGVTDEQAEKIKGSTREELAKMLDEKQMLRLHQIELQRRGLPALADKDVGAALKLTEEQEKSIKKIIDDSDKERREAFPAGTKSSLGERMAKVEGMKKVAFDKIRALFTDDQKKAWTALNGEPFHLQLPFAGGTPKKKG